MRRLFQASPIASSKSRSSSSSSSSNTKHSFTFAALHGLQLHRCFSLDEFDFWSVRVSRSLTFSAPVGLVVPRSAPQWLLSFGKAHLSPTLSVHSGSPYLRWCVKGSFRFTRLQWQDCSSFCQPQRHSFEAITACREMYVQATPPSPLSRSLCTFSDVLSAHTRKNKMQTQQHMFDQ